MEINGNVIARTVSVRFLRILLEKHLLWNKYTKYVLNKIVKNIRILNKAKQYLHVNVCSHYIIHSYMSFMNIALASANVTKLIKINNQQKHAIRLENNKGIFSHLRDLLRLDKTLNAYQLNILNFTTFIHRF